MPATTNRGSSFATEAKPVPIRGKLSKAEDFLTGSDDGTSSKKNHPPADIVVERRSDSPVDLSASLQKYSNPELNHFYSQQSKQGAANNNSRLSINLNP
jgi:hypothetical protein